MPEHTPEQHLARLSAAIESFLAHRARADAQTDAELLARHPELRDLLEPMLAEQDAEEEPAPSQRFFGDFKLLRELGRGGMGVVYEAEEVALARRVALKLLPSHPSLSPLQIERFRREAAAAGRLQHPGIAAVHRVGEVDGTHYFAMELVRGRDLAAALAEVKRGCVDPADLRGAVLGVLPGAGYFAEVAEIAIRVATALHHAHEHGIVHRDVKPHNVMLATGGGVRLVDFGLARDFDRAELSRTGDAAGSPHWMSPEQILGERVDRRTDVYSLGVVLYELLTLRRPFEGKTHEVLQAIISREPAPIRRLQPRVPRDLETICSKALEKDPAGRYATAREMAEDLQRFVRFEPIAAVPPSALTRSIKLVRRHRAATLAVLFALLALVIAPIVFALHYKSSRDTLALEQAETARQRDLAAGILAKALEALDDLYTWLAEDRLASEPHLEQVRRELLQRALGFYAEFGRLAGDEPRLRIASAAAEVRLGTILEKLQDRAGSTLHLTRALASYGELAGSAPELAVVLSDAHESLGTTLANAGRVEEAAAHLDAAVDVLAAIETLPEAQRERGRRQLAAALETRARHVLSTSGDAARAEDDLARALALWRAGAEATASPEYTRQKICALQLRRALGFAERERFAEAAEALAEAREISEALVRAQSTRVEPRRLLFDALIDQGQVLDRLHEPAAASAAFQRAIEVAGGLCRDFPSFPRFGGDLAKAEYSLGVLLVGQDDLASAEPHFDRALAGAQACVAAAPDMLAAVSLVALASNALTGVRAQLGAPLSAVVESFERAVATLEPLVAQHPEQLVLAEQLTLVLANLGRAYVGVGDHERAHANVARAVSMVRELRAALPDQTDLRDSLGMNLATLAEIELALGRHADAAASAGELVELTPEDAAVHAQAARYLAQCLELAERDAGLADEERGPLARAYGARAVAHLRAAVERRPELAGHIAAEPAFAPLRAIPGFAELVR